MKDSLLIAVGGNSLIRAGQQGTIPEQFANARLVCEQIAELAISGYKVVVTHGNGPQVGAQLLRSEAGSGQTYPVPLDVCVAMTQGEIGYILQTTLQSVFRERYKQVPVVALITQILVSGGDPAFKRPTKPVGPFYSEQSARRKEAELGWDTVEDASRGYRRVVPSPRPCGIVELDIIYECLSRSMIVIAAGGGGIPVVQDGGTIRGVEAVIDKDLASALLASQLGLERLLISTDVERVCLNYKQPGEKPIDRIDVEEARALVRAGEFQEGSMKPKIEAAIAFLDGGGSEVIITNQENLAASLEGQSGTHIVAKRPPSRRDY
jgi:carbamate kinase